MISDECRLKSFFNGMLGEVLSLGLQTLSDTLYDTTFKGQGVTKNSN